MGSSKKYIYLFVGKIKEDQPYTKRFALTGHNTGNLLFMNAMQKQLIGSNIGGSIFNPDNLQEADCIVIPSSNFINDFSDFSQIADQIEKSDLPCLMAGVGAQSNSYSHIPKLKEGTLRFLKIVSERTKTIGVRGEYSAEILNHYNIKNVSIVGCPSLFTSCKPNLKIKKNKINKIVFNGSRNLAPYSFNPKKVEYLEKEIFRYAFDMNSPYILQNEMPEITTIEKVKNKTVEISDYEEIMKIWNISSKKSKDFVTFFNKKVNCFFDVDEWFNFVKDYDFIFGSRFHGSMAGLINSVPVFIITQDTRTDELAKLMKIPHKSTHEIDNIDLERIIEEAEFEDFEHQYNYLYENYIDLLNKNEIEHNLISK